MGADMVRAPATFDDTACEQLLPAVVRGDGLAWGQLVQRLAPEVERILRGSRTLRGLPDADHQRNVLTRVLERLHRNDFRALRQYPPWRERHGGRRTFRDWLTIVSTNVARDYVSERLGESKAAPAGAKRLVASLATTLDQLERDLGHRPAYTEQQMVRQILDYAADNLPEDQLQALTGWLGGHDLADIARELELAGGDAANRLVRAALARLRRQFAT
jgi:hypothetical protein